MNDPTATLNATFCATVVDQWVREGLQAAFIAPGSRSTPLVVALTNRADIDVMLFHDERSASFAALGHALSAGVPAVIACTSGTAAAHFHAAVIEADLSAVPMIVCTADRPPELWGRGAPQTIDQTEIYGDAARAFIEPGPPRADRADTWRDMAQQAWSYAVGPTPGPVHLNLSFREPLLGEPDTLPEPIPERPALATDIVDVVGVVLLRSLTAIPRGVIVAGRNETDPELIVALGERLGWPIIADHRSGCRGERRPVIHRYDALLRHEAFAKTHRPEAILRIGEIVSSKAVSQWMKASDAPCMASRPHGRLIDPERIASNTFDESGVIEALLDAIGDPPTDTDWLDSWRRADDRAEAVIISTLVPYGGGTEIDVARRTVDAVPSGGALVVASSMPVRDVEWFGPARTDIDVISNRGANGIDGTIATAIGVAQTRRPTICLIGDVALLHDSTSLAGLHARDLDLTIVVIDNDGGGIFSFLPQHEQLDAATYETLFGTPHRTDFKQLARAHRLPVSDWPSDLTPSGVRVVVATSDRATNLAVHNAVHATVGSRLDAGDC